MKKILLVLLAVILVSGIACQQATRQQASQKPEVPASTAAPGGTAGDAAVDSVGKNLNNIDNVEKDLNADQLNDINASLQEIQNIK